MVNQQGFSIAFGDTGYVRLVYSPTTTSGFCWSLCPVNDEQRWFIPK